MSVLRRPGASVHAQTPWQPRCQKTGTTTGWQPTQGNIEGDGKPGRCVAIVFGLHSSFLRTQRLAEDEVNRLFQWKTSALCRAKVVPGMRLAG